MQENYTFRTKGVAIFEILCRIELCTNCTDERGSNMKKSKINNPIEQWRVLNRLSQELMSKEIGFSRQTYRSRINGTSEWTAPEITKLIKLTGKTYTELFS
jgi:DNA-binding XRE family transcriptional regulator